jgi:hypothetical protein
MTAGDDICLCKAVTFRYQTPHRDDYYWHPTSNKKACSSKETGFKYQQLLSLQQGRVLTNLS